MNINRHLRNIQVIVIAIFLLLIANACDNEQEINTANDNTEDMVQQPVEIPNNHPVEQSDDEEKPDGTLGVLKLSVEQTESGFQLKYADQGDIYVTNTWISRPIDGIPHATHIIRRIMETDKGIILSRDAVVVNPDTREFRIFPMYSAIVEDTYKSETIAEAYGFVDDRHMIFVAVVNDDVQSNSYYYRVEQLDILSGETTVLLEKLPDSPEDGLYAKGGLNSKKDTLVLNGYQSGLLWAFDLTKKQLSTSEFLFQHSWPFYMTVPSPTGDYFWYANYDKKEYSLHDLSGKSISSFPMSEGFDQYPIIQWSPDSLYSVYQDTMDQSDQHMIDDSGEIYIIAPQRIRFYNASGKLVRTVNSDSRSDAYMELGGWLDGAQDTVLLHEFELDQNPSVRPKAKINSRYRLLNIHTGEEQALQSEPDLSRLNEAIPARSSTSGTIYWVDLQSGLVTASEKPGIWLTGVGQSLQAAIIPNYVENETLLISRNSATEEVQMLHLKYVDPDTKLIDGGWLIGGEMQYIRL